MTEITKENGARSLPYDELRLLRFINAVTEEWPHLDVDDYAADVIRTITSKPEFAAEAITNTLELKALDRVGVESEEDGTHPDWQYVAARVRLRRLYKQASNNRVYDANERYGPFYALLKELTTQGIYDAALLREYSRAEINEMARAIDPELDRLFNYIGLVTLADRYLAKSHDGDVYELPQERFLIVAMTLMIGEDRTKRLDLVREAYWALSNLYMTVATPTLANAGKSYGQLSSCFIDTVADDLRSIYDSNTDVATLSKGGGGIGVYLGKVRARGSDIKGFKGVSSGIVPWIRQLNNTAVAVDQLGVRSGAVAVYLDVWHRDIEAFLDLRLNNGDERLRAHDVFTGVCIPDIFMEAVRDRRDWYLFDPHEIRKLLGYSLEDSFDEERGKGTFRQRYQECVDHPLLQRVRVPAIDVMKRIMKSQLETGTPYMFYRDEVNRMNPNKHAGLIYCSNLCTEIAQNMSATTVYDEILDDDVIITYKKAGDFVVCNLSSINLPRTVEADVMERLIPIQVRMLDNVIDLNADKIEVKQAVATNRKYRAIGLGGFGWAHLLARKKIRWESEEAVRYCDELYEKIAFLTIKASADLAREKGAYPAFEGSEWQTGEYFGRRRYLSDVKWGGLADYVSRVGIRNGYLMAPAPNMSTAKIGGSTDGIDPIFKRSYAEEKKNFKLPVVAPDLSPETFWYYKSAYDIDQAWSIRQNAARQRHVDQSISFNLYVRSDIKAADLLALHMLAWESGLKSTYYVRSIDLTTETCDACAS